jgi:glutathione peroxidase
MSDFYGFAVPGIDGAPNALAPLRGHVALAVNVASRCGYTSQYAGLEELYRELQAERFSVVGFPCNQFGAQEPGTESEIRAFCSTTYQVTFPMTSKIDVNGPTRHPLYAWLTDPANGFPGDIGWNFEKFLIGRDGAVLKRYPPGTKPRDNGLMQDIANAL